MMLERPIASIAPINHQRCLLLLLSTANTVAAH